MEVAENVAWHGSMGRDSTAMVVWRGWCSVADITLEMIVLQGEEENHRSRDVS
jgi:hypothetical protein